MKLTPLADRVVLKMTEAEETTKGGIILTGCCQGEARRGRGHGCGPRRHGGRQGRGHDREGRRQGHHRASTPAPKVKLDGEEYIIVKQGDILAIVE